MSCSWAHLMHVKLTEDGLQKSRITLHHVQLEGRARSTIAHNERDSAKDKRVPMAGDSLPGEVLCMDTWGQGVRKLGPVLEQADILNAGHASASADPHTAN